ncbi:MAG: lactate utilization protein [Chitinophagaceae bacterium]|jgi:L-lactate dehydrogenase complex protein LldG|nr:lactate utilization protein [Chitinophagaceae bacterium]
MTSNSRESIIGKIRKALAENSLPMPFPEADKLTAFYDNGSLSPEEKFAQEFSALGGKFVYCENEQELMEQLDALADTMRWTKIHSKDSFLLTLFQEQEITLVQQGNDMSDIEVGISLCESLVARTGSVLVSAAQEYGRALPVYSPIHITVAFANQLVWDISDAFTLLNEKYKHNLPSLISLTTGPSRTADIEKTLVVGVHGPKEVYVFFVDKNWNT